jgi:hypothetical protein
VLLLANLSAHSVDAQDAALFTKTFPDGSKVRLTSSTITEFRSRPRSANPNAPESEIYADREWKLVTYTLLLKRPAIDKEERLWSKDLEYSVADKKMDNRIGTMAVNDVLLIGDRAYVLYAEGFVSVVNSTRNSDGEWLWTAPTDLVQSTDVYPVVKWQFTPQAKPQIAIDMIVHDKVRTWIWNLKNNRWVWTRKDRWSKP